MLSLGVDEGSGLGSGLEGQQGRPGFLNLLDGLTKLIELRGSFNAITDETKVTMGWAEVRWMASYWPTLKVAEFFRGDEELTEPFLWLRG
ncbi:hypothetical protein BGX30_013463, partial [Mortierella sp. GBA39]